MCDSESVSNCVILLCVLKTAAGQKFIKPGLRSRNISLKKIISRFKLYLGYEHRVHESRTINEVCNAQNLVGKLIENIKVCVPGDDENGNGRGWNLPTMHTFANLL